jgi:diguanylate cyclase (GGDEF)-like protein
MLESYEGQGGTTALKIELPELLAAVAAPVAALRLGPDKIYRPIAINPALVGLLDGRSENLAVDLATVERAGPGPCTVSLGGVPYPATFRPVRCAGPGREILIATFGVARSDRVPAAVADHVQALELRLKFALEAGEFGLWEEDVAADRARFDPVFLARHGWSARHGELPLAELRARIHPRDRARVRSAYGQCRRGERTSLSIEYRVQRRDGGYAWVQEHATVGARDAAGRPVRLIGMTTDITARKEAEERLAHLALHDDLTGLPNRRALADALERALARAQRSGLALAVLALDLDGFKSINDRHGHPAGDAALVEIAARLRRTVRRSDAVARLGGDEFAVIAGELRGQQPVLRLARRLSQILAQPVQLQDGRAQVGVSIGVAFYPGDGDTPDSLLLKADQALYAAKHEGVGWRLFADLRDLAPTGTP